MEGSWSETRREKPIFALTGGLLNCVSSTETQFPHYLWIIFNISSSYTRGQQLGSNMGQFFTTLLNGGEQFIYLRITNCFRILRSDVIFILFFKKELTELQRLTKLLLICQRMSHMCECIVYVLPWHLRCNDRQSTQHEEEACFRAEWKILLLWIWLFGVHSSSSADHWYSLLTSIKPKDPKNLGLCLQRNCC